MRFSHQQNYLKLKVKLSILTAWLYKKQSNNHEFYLSQIQELYNYEKFALLLGRKIPADFLEGCSFKSLQLKNFHCGNTFNVLWGE